MSEQHNPYAAPRAALEAVLAQGQSVWRAGKLLVCTRDAIFPNRCVKCNAPAEPPLVRYKLGWHSGWWYLLILVQVIVYVIVGLLVRKRAEIDVGLCERHQRRRRNGRILSVAGLIAIVAAIVLGANLDMWPLMAGGMIAILPWLIVVLILVPQLSAARITKEEIRVKGCGKDFLDSLPEHLG
jgi:hypothetical protein